MPAWVLLTAKRATVSRAIGIVSAPSRVSFTWPRWLHVKHWVRRAQEHERNNRVRVRFNRIDCNGAKRRRPSDRPWVDALSRPTTFPYTARHANSTALLVIVAVVIGALWWLLSDEPFQT
jgi:hypothetical protein